jgi:CRISPR system Cascade subunit CasB
MPEPTRVPPQADRMVRQISKLTASNPADRSVLRHSLGQAPKEVSLGVHRIVVPLLPENHSETDEQAYYTVAALIASQPRQARDQAHADDGSREPGSGDPGSPAGRGRHNLGYSLAQAADKGASEKGLEDRLQLLARQNLDGVHRQLPRLIIQLRNDQVRIDWGVLIRDLSRWAGDPRQVAKEWAQEYYRTSERLTAEKRRNAEKTTEGTGIQEEQP